MAEVAASIVAFIQLADHVIRVCNHFITATKDAPRDMIIISSEVTSLRAILSCFSEADLHPMTAEALPALFASSGPIQACHRSIGALERLLPKIPADPTKKTSFCLADLSWALKDAQVRKLLADISLHKSTLLLALTGDLMREIKDIKAGVERVEETLSGTERNEALKWLQHKCHSPSAIHISIFKNHEEHTNSWLHRCAEWNAWLEPCPSTDITFIWIYGIPGAGKSVMASFIIEWIKTHCGSRDQLGYAYYYCHYSHKEDEGSPFLRWVAGQLCRQAEWAPQQLKRLRDSGCDPTIAEILMVLESVLERFDTVFVVIDGVDESEPRSQLLAILTTLATDKRFEKVRLLATSRQSHDIEKAFSSIAAGISMSNGLVRQDIRTVVHEWIIRSPRMARWSHLFQYIEDKLCFEAQGMFRWVACQMQIIERMREESQLIEALDNLPRDLDEVYLRILAGIPEQDRLFVRRVLLWIAGHTSSGRLRDKGIHIDVLVSAVCDDLRYMTGKSYRYTAEDLKELCGCLITVKDGPLPFTDFLAELDLVQNIGEEWYICRKDHDEDAPNGPFVEISHYTVMEFLASDRITASPAHAFSVAFDETRVEFFESVLRQALAADPTGTSADWVRDRDAYCLTLAPLIMSSVDVTEASTLNLCIPYFQPTSPHFPRLRYIQCYLAAGCLDAQSFLMARLPVYHPALPPSTYELNNPNAWALLGMLVTYNTRLAKAFLGSLGLDHNISDGQEIVVSFLTGAEVREDGIVGLQTYRGVLRDVILAQDVDF